MKCAFVNFSPTLKNLSIDTYIQNIFLYDSMGDNTQEQIEENSTYVLRTISVLDVGIHLIAGFTLVDIMLHCNEHVGYRCCSLKMR